MNLTHIISRERSQNRKRAAGGWLQGCGQGGDGSSHVELLGDNSWCKHSPPWAFFPSTVKGLSRGLHCRIWDSARTQEMLNTNDHWNYQSDWVPAFKGTVGINKEAEGGPENSAKGVSRAGFTEWVSGAFSAGPWESRWVELECLGVVGVRWGRCGVDRPTEKSAVSEWAELCDWSRLTKTCVPIPRTAFILTAPGQDVMAVMRLFVCFPVKTTIQLGKTVDTEGRTVVARGWV